MAGKKQGRAKSKDTAPLQDDHSDGDSTPTQDNRTDNENGTDTDQSIASRPQRASTESRVQDLQEASTATTTASMTDDLTNPHSAQAVLEKSLNPPDHVTKMNDLVVAAAARAARRNERAIAKRAKKRQELAKTATKSAASKPASKPASKHDGDSSSQSSSSSSQVSSSSSDQEYEKKPKAKKGTKSKAGKQKLQQNTYDILNSSTPTKNNTTSGLSKTARKRQKKLNRTHNTFFCAKIKVKSSSNGKEELHKKTKKWYNYLRQVDDTSIIYPFKDVNPTSVLFSTENIPDSLAPFRNYFHQANPRLSEGHVWLNMHIGHTEAVDDILREMGNYKNDTDTFTYAKKLQTRYVAKEYFILWLTDYIDVATLTAEVHNRISEITDTKYQFAFAWSEIKGIDGK